MIRRRSMHLRVPFAAALLLCSGCGDDDTTDPGPPPPDVTVTLASFGPSSPAQGHYELWISFALLREGGWLRHSEAASAGKFRIGANGAPVNLAGAAIEFEVSPEDPNAPVENGKILWQLAIDAFVTVEPEGDSDAVPELPGIIAGSFLNRSATLGIDAPDAIDVAFGAAAGSLHLATPTTVSSDDEGRGVWFAAPGGAAASLTLPTLSAGTLWTYEGWVQHPSAGIASLGKFLAPSGADQDGAGPLGGSGGYAFPGSDFPFVAAGTGVDLSNSTVFVTVEPPNDADGAGPFFFQVLRVEMSGAAPGTAIAMTSPAGAPSGTVKIPSD